MDVAQRRTGPHREGRARRASPLAVSPSYSRLRVTTMPQTSEFTYSGGLRERVVLLTRMPYWPALICDSVISHASIWYSFLHAPPSPLTPTQPACGEAKDEWRLAREACGGAGGEGGGRLAALVSKATRVTPARAGASLRGYVICTQPWGDRVTQTRASGEWSVPEWGSGSSWHVCGCRARHQPRLAKALMRALVSTGSAQPGLW